ncbi:MAG: flagellar hook-basal body complex protein [Lachnospiraceae bacterium]|nr:flagellar hook-basal body complex protein [Lachnospiraceae bacterium]
MMRSLFSGVAGLKTHQTRMDVIGNNIANVNTTAYKSQSMTFSDIFYQTTQNASGASQNRGGVNARQIGLGVQTSAISTAIEQQGASQTTNNPFDIMISGDAFFVVNNGNEQLYTRDGTFYVDGAGNLAMQSTGYLVQGWQSKQNEDGSWGVDVNGGIGRLQIMNEANTYYPPAATTDAVMSGNIDMNDTNVRSAAGRVMTLEFYDDRGYLYTAKFAVKMMKNDDGTPMTTATVEDSQSSATDKKTNIYDYLETDAIDNLKDETEDIVKNKPLYSITLMDILDSKNVSIDAEAFSNVTFGSSSKWNVKMTNKVEPTTTASDFSSGSLQRLKTTAKDLNDPNKNDAWAGIGGQYFGLSDAVIDSYGKDATFTYDAGTKTMTITSNNKTSTFAFNPDTGALMEGSDLMIGFGDGTVTNLESFKNVAFDSSTITNVNTNGTSTFKATKGAMDGETGTGRMVGEMNGISVETDGKIWASYSNGQTKLLGQIASAEFANASGLEKSGDNLYKQTNNSGEAAIQDISVDGGRMNTGVLEMSNVDLSNEFTTMITTQRGFQANSRIITVSDTLLEELTNLKR